MTYLWLLEESTVKTRRAGRGDRSRSAVGWVEARGPRRGSRQTHLAKRPCPQLRRLRLELLEDRRLLTGYLVDSLDDTIDADGDDPRQSTRTREFPGICTWKQKSPITNPAT